jgi:D-glycero-D-manno-heptose 1,7-bisphosphate phosphatase
VKEISKFHAVDTGAVKPGNKKKRAVFLDRDGVINENRHDYVKTWDEFVFLPGAIESLALLSQSEFLVIVISNQSAIYRGLVSGEMVEEINRLMVNTVEKAGARIDGVYFCPHGPGEACDCRKPRPGLLLKAAEEKQIDLTQSFCVGDKLTDIDSGIAAGCRNILVLTGEGEKQNIKDRDDFVVVRNLHDAVEIILKNGFDALKSIMHHSTQNDLSNAMDQTTDVCSDKSERGNHSKNNGN